MADWYRTGTVTVTNGSLSVTGITTGWTDSTVKPGDALFVPASSNYPGEIDSRVSATSLLLAATWHGTSQTSVPYFIFKGMEWGDVTRLAVQISELIANQTDVLSGVGAPSSGLGADGSVYFRQDVPEYYAKAAGSWGTAISLTGPAGPTGALSTGTSTSTVSIGTGSKTFTTQASRAWVVGTRLRIASSANPTTAYMEGVITSYSSTTVILTVDKIVGSGTIASWNLGIAGDVGTTGSTGASYAATSTTSLAIGTGTKVFTTQAGLAYVVGSRARAANTANTANFMEGRVTAYSGTSLTISVDITGGSGTLASWNISLAGERGTQGIQGVDGPQGIQGVAGPGYYGTSSTSITVGTGTKVFTTQAGLAYSVGASRVRWSDASGANYVEGLVTGYSSTTMTVAVDRSVGSGTITSWFASLAGDVGAAGTNGVSFVFRGDYSGATAYVANNVVINQNSTWICILATTGNAPPTLPTTSNTYWTAMAIRGVDGDGSTDSVNGIAAIGGNVTISASDIAAALTPTSYSVLGTSINDHLTGINSAIAAGANYAVTALASSSTVDIGAAATVAVTISGTTTITSLGTVANTLRIVRFLGALTLTHNATSLILPDGANISTVAGDTFLMLSDASGNWRAYRISANRANGPGFKNKLRNPNFQINQRVVSGSVVLAAGAYGHDGWKAGASGCTYTFAESNGVVTLTISAGSLVQSVEGGFFIDQSGTYCLSWTGTAQGKIGAGSFSSSGVTGSLTGGTVSSVEFNTGTLSRPQLELGAIPTVFESRAPLELPICQRYFQKSARVGTAPGNGATSSLDGTYAPGVAYNTSNGDTALISFPVRMRNTPTIVTYSTNAAGSPVNGRGNVNILGTWTPCTADHIGTATNESGFALRFQVATSFTAGYGYNLSVAWTASAEL